MNEEQYREEIARLLNMISDEAVLRRIYLILITMTRG